MRARAPAPRGSQAGESRSVLTRDLDRPTTAETRLRYQDDVEGLPRLVPPKRLAKQSLGPIPLHGAPDVPTDR